jgi:hypothetical protein
MAASQHVAKRSGTSTSINGSDCNHMAPCSIHSGCSAESDGLAPTKQAHPTANFSKSGNRFLSSVVQLVTIHTVCPKTTMRSIFARLRTTGGQSIKRHFSRLIGDSKVENK